MNKSSVGRLVGIGLLSAVAFGAVMGLIAQNVGAGIACGAFYGIAMALVMRRQWGSTALKGLSFDQRKQVMKALRQGEPARDPDLMIPLVTRGQAILAQPYRPTLGRVMFTLMFLVGVLQAAFGASEGMRGPIGGGLLALMSLVMIFGLIPYTARVRERAARSLAATEQILVSQLAREA